MTKKRFSSIIVSVIVLITMPLILLTVCTLTGDGITFESVSASIGTRRALSAMKSGQYEQSAKHIDFWGFSEDRRSIDHAYIEDERQRFIEGLEEFFASDMSMEGYEILNSVTDDGYTIVTTRIMLSSKEDTHNFVLRLSKQNGRLCPMGVVVDASDEETAIVADTFMNIVKTHYGG